MSSQNPPQQRPGDEDDVFDEDDVLDEGEALDEDEELDEDDAFDEDDDLEAPLQAASSGGSSVERLEQIITPVVEDFGLELYDIEFGTRRGRAVLEVTIDRRDGRAPGQGVTLSELIEVNREISALLDVEDPIEDRYALEVQSPGVERPLTRPRHFERSLGESVHIVFNRIIDGQTAVDGTLSAFADGRATVTRADDSEVCVELESIKSARTAFDWAGAKGRKKGGDKKGGGADSRTRKKDRKDKKSKKNKAQGET